jgi:hypothetical protein
VGIEELYDLDCKKSAGIKDFWERQTDKSLSVC